MWSDNETTTDLIGFKVHANLVREVVTDPNILPVVLGGEHAVIPTSHR